MYYNIKVSKTKHQMGGISYVYLQISISLRLLSSNKLSFRKGVEMHNQIIIVHLNQVSLLDD